MDESKMTNMPEVKAQINPTDDVAEVLISRPVDKKRLLTPDEAQYMFELAEAVQQKIDDVRTKTMWRSYGIIMMFMIGGLALGMLLDFEFGVGTHLFARYFSDRAWLPPFAILTAAVSFGLTLVLILSNARNIDVLRRHRRSLRQLVHLLRELAELSDLDQRWTLGEQAIFRIRMAYFDIAPDKEKESLNGPSDVVLKSLKRLSQSLFP